MAIGGFFKKTFGKQNCAFCGSEVGMMSRTKIRNGEFICNECSHCCSAWIQRYRFDKDELLGHMEYMKRQAKLFDKLEGKFNLSVPTSGVKQAIEFYDDYGMFRIRDRDQDKKYPKELIRYDQVAKYEPYCDESEPDEPGKEKAFGECGVKLTLVGAAQDLSRLPRGMRAHPYIIEQIKVCINDRDKRIGMMDVDHIIMHFDQIFGVHDDTKGLLSFGPTQKQKREMDAAKAMGGMFGAAVRAARSGELAAGDAGSVMEAMNKVSNAATGGLAEYTRRADAAENMI